MQLFNTKSKAELIKESLVDTTTRRTVSWYRYVTIHDPQTFRDSLFLKLQNLSCKGRIYIAQEGINAQMNVPIKNWDAFCSVLDSFPELSDMRLNAALEEQGVSFLKLTIKVRKKIVADGLDDSFFNPSDTGEYVDALDVNKKIQNKKTIFVDMRNGYEAEIGRFENALTMNVITFREQLGTVENLASKHKDEEIVLYCTGGIRCEKASAWMKYRGFKNVKHIRGGVISYARDIKKLNLPSFFKGKNFVFDGRMAEKVTDDTLAHCHICQKYPSDIHTHCLNKHCHRLYIGCNDCKKKTHEHCSQTCRFIGFLPERMQIFLFRNGRRGRRQQVICHLRS